MKSQTDATAAPAERQQRSGRSVTGNTAWALAAELLRAGAGAGVVFGLALFLTQDEIGRYAAVFAIGNAAAMIGHVGAPFVFIREEARGGDVAASFQRMMGTVFIGGVVASIALVAARPILLDEVTFEVFSIMIVSRLLPFAIAESAVATATSARDQRFGFGLRVINTLGRVVPLVPLAMMDAPTLLDWAVFSALGFWLSAGIMMVLVLRSFALPALPRRPRRQDLGQGVPLALKLGAGSLLSSVDRPVLVAKGFGAEAGSYAIGARVAELGQLPVMALVRTTSPDFFAAGNSGFASARRLAVRLTLPAAGVGVVMGALLFVSAPLVPYLLGSEWNDSVDVIRLLAPLPFLNALQRFSGNALTGADAPLTQFWALLGATGLNLAANLVLIPRIGLNGAVVSTLVAEAVYAAVLWGLLARAVRQERDQALETR